MREGRVGCGRVRVQAGPRGPESRPGALSPAMQMRVLGHRAMPRNSTKTDLVFVPPILDETRFGFRAATQPRTSRRSRTRQPRARTQLVPLRGFAYTRGMFSGRKSQARAVHLMFRRRFRDYSPSVPPKPIDAVVIDLTSCKEYLIAVHYQCTSALMH
jgi:hypothetical protein